MYIVSYALIISIGCSRGIGLGLTQQFLERTNAKVIATSRDPDSSEGLQNLLKQYGEERLLLPKLDVLNEENFSQLKEQLREQGINSIDILLGNAGVAPNMDMEKKTLLNSTEDEMRDAFDTNVLGNMRLLQNFHDMLCASTIRLAVMMSSSHGSLTIACSSQGSPAAYRCSKVALNMMSLLYAVDPAVREAGIKVVIFHPGWYYTPFVNYTIRARRLTLEGDPHLSREPKLYTIQPSHLIYPCISGK